MQNQAKEISMRRVVGVEWIDAYVTEFDTAGGREWSEGRDRESA